jgi:hypothetical protein
VVRRLCIVFLFLTACVPPLAAQSYRYDDAGRLVRVAYMQGGGAAYQYDVSNNMTAVMPLDLLPAPTIEEVTRLSPTEARITWQAQPGASEYIIERRQVGSNEWERIATAPGGATSLVDDALDPGADYVYRASAVNQDGESAYSAEAASPAIPTPTATRTATRTATPTPSPTPTALPTITRTVTPTTGDVNGDGRRSAADIVALALVYGSSSEEGSRADLDRNGTVDEADLEILIELLFTP